MKQAVFLSAALLFIGACSPKLGSEIISGQTPLKGDAAVLVLDETSTSGISGIEIGSLRSGDNGFSIHCSYADVIERLKQMARQNGANIIKITEHKKPDNKSSCDRIKARIYKVDDIRAYEKKIGWSADRKLTWQDFKAAPVTGTDFGAATSAGFSYQSLPGPLFSRIKFVVKNTFNCELSWVNPKHNTNAYLLSHEQLHFDICEVHARLLRKKFAGNKLTIFNIKQCYAYFDEIFAKYEAQQKLFDEESDHGINAEKQAEWRNKTDAALLELHMYAE